MAPFIVLIILKDVTIINLIGIGIGFSGVFISVQQKISGNITVYGVMLTICATVSFAVGTVFYQKRIGYLHPIITNCIQNLSGALFMLPLSWKYFGQIKSEVNFIVILSIIYLVLAVSIGAFLLWLFIITKLGGTKAMSIHLINPIWGGVLSWMVFDTNIYIADIVGCCFVMIGLLLVLFDFKKVLHEFIDKLRVQI